jgi:site-specific DNA recombinase
MYPQRRATLMDEVKENTRSAPRVAIYARMSTDKQSPQSPDDQIRECRRFATSKGWVISESLIVTEAGVSAGSRHNRPGLTRLLESEIGRWDVLLCFDSSRLARNGEVMGWIRNQLSLWGKDAYEAVSGLSIQNLGSRVMDVVNENYLEKLRHDTRRGLRGQVERGYSGGGKPFGFRTVPDGSGGVDARGEAVPAGYLWEIDSDQALVVHRIFEEYISGAGFTQIAQRLNEQGVESPRPRASDGRGWCPSAVRTIITNPKYKGCFIWNQSEWRKDHSTGRRKRFERPREEWVIQDRPDLQIVTPEVWEQANRTRRSRSGSLPRKRDGTLAGGSIGSGRRPTHLLSGLLRCGECGGPVHIVGGGKYGCGWRHKRGPTICSAERCIKPDDLEARVLGTIQTQILVPEIIEEVACRSLDLAKSRFDHAQQSFSADRRRLDEIALEERNLSCEIAKLGSSDEFYAVLDELHEEKDAIQS